MVSPIPKDWIKWLLYLEGTNFVFYNDKNGTLEGVSIMNCPFCGEVMKESTFCDRGGSYFLPAGEARPALWTKHILEKKHAVLLSPEAFGVSFELRPAAFWCGECKKLLVDYKELSPVEE